MYFQTFLITFPFPEIEIAVSEILQKFDLFLLLKEETLGNSIWEFRQCYSTHEWGRPNSKALMESVQQWGQRVFALKGGKRKKTHLMSESGKNDFRVQKLFSVHEVYS